MKDATMAKTAMAAVFVLAISASPAPAQGLFFGMMSEQTPVKYHEDTTRQVTRAQAQKSFSDMDANKDGAVTMDEYAAAYNKGVYPAAGGKDTGASAKAAFRILDGNRDGRVTRQEFIANRNVPVTVRESENVPNGARRDE